MWNEVEKQAQNYERLFMIAWFHLSIILKYKLFISYPPPEKNSHSVDKTEMFVKIQLCYFYCIYV